MFYIRVLWVQHLEEQEAKSEDILLVSLLLIFNAFPFLSEMLCKLLVFLR